MNERMHRIVRFRERFRRRGWFAKISERHGWNNEEMTIHQHLLILPISSLILSTPKVSTFPSGIAILDILSQIWKSASQPVAVGESSGQPFVRSTELPVSSATEIASSEHAQYRRGRGVLQAPALQHHRQGSGEPGRLAEEPQVALEQQRGV